MSEPITVERGLRWWEVTDRLMVVQYAPITTDPKTGKNVDPTSMDMTYRWVDGAWALVAASVEGLEIDEDGNHPDDEEIEVDFYDPVGGGSESGGAPGWVVDLANKRMAKLPPVPEGAE